MNKLTNASFSQLVVQYERLVYTVCFQLVRDAAAAEDLTQETFLSAYLHRDAIPPITHNLPRFLANHGHFLGPQLASN